MINGALALPATAYRVYLHCMLGKDRLGIVCVVLRLVVEGLDEEAVTE